MKTETTTARVSPKELVNRLADKSQRNDAYAALHRLGKAAVHAAREGLGDGRWQVRRWCAAILDHCGGPESRKWLVPLLRDPKADVRLWAVHTIGCERCIGGQTAPVPVVPLLLERLWQDESIRVRRQAACGLGMQAQSHPSAELASIYRDILERETDEKVRKHAAYGLMRCLSAGVNVK